MSIAHRDLDVSVSHEFLYRDQVHSSKNKIRGKSVTEVMESAFPDSGSSNSVIEGFLDRCELLPITIENIAFFGPWHAIKDLLEGLVHRDVTYLAAF